MREITVWECFSSLNDEFKTIQAKKMLEVIVEKEGG